MCIDDRGYGYDYDYGPEGKWCVYHVSRVWVHWVTGRRSPSFTATTEEVGHMSPVEMNIIQKAIILCTSVWLSAVLGSVVMP